jgi:hypothetical protein
MKFGSVPRVVSAVVVVLILAGYLWLMRRHAMTVVDSPVHPVPSDR